MLTPSPTIGWKIGFALSGLLLILIMLVISTTVPQVGMAARLQSQDAISSFSYEYAPSGAVCGTTGPSPNQMELQAFRKDGGQTVEFEVRKCPGLDPDFRLSGDVDLLIDGQFYQRYAYSAGVSEIEIEVKPLEIGKPGFHDYQAWVRSDDQWDIPKHTGVIRVWEEYDAPADIQRDLTYGIEPDGPQCGNIVALELDSTGGSVPLIGKITKCSGENQFGQSGYFYFLANGEAFLGPISSTTLIQRITG
jgi:hypothetical protein